MIRDAATQIVDLAQTVTGLRKTQQHGQALARRQQAIVAALDRLIRARSAVERLSQSLDGVPPESTAASTATACEHVDAWADALDEDLAAALSTDGFARMNDLVLRVVGELETQASGLWLRFMAQHSTQTSREVLEALANDPGTRSAVLRIERLANQLGAIRERTVPSEDDIVAFLRASGELRDVWSTLNVDGIDPEVVAFLRSANSSRGAPIAALTANVLAWLEQRGVSGQYVVRPAD
jgi:hypothetical protein